MAGFLPSSAVIESLDEVFIESDGFAYFGSSQQAALGWETADANANELILSLPAGGATDVPAFVVGIGLTNVDLGWFNGVTQTHFAVADADRDSYVALAFSADDVVAIYSKHLVGGSKQNRLGFSSTETVLNDDQADLNLRVETDGADNAMLLDAGAFTGIGRWNFGSDPGSDAQYFVIRPPARTAPANTNHETFVVSGGGGAITIPAGTAARVATASFFEANITATGTVTTATTVYVGDAPTEGGTNYGLWVNTIGAITAGIALVGAASTNNQILLVQNTSNAAAASHAIVDIAVGGTTSTGDAQLRWTIPSGASWYAGPDNSSGDDFYLGTGTTVGTLWAIRAYGSIAVMSTSSDDGYMTVAPQASNVTIASSSTANFATFRVVGNTHTYTGTTQVTGLVYNVVLGNPTLAGDTATLTIDKATTLKITAPTESTNILLTDTSAIRILNTAGTPTNQIGLYIETLTAGGSDYGIFIAGADTAAIWVNSADPIHVGLAGTATGKMEWSGATSGTVTLTVAATAGTWTMTLPAAVGGAGEQLTDAAGNGVTSWAAAASRREYKQDILSWDRPQDALDTILGTQVYQYHYQQGRGTLDYATRYVGPMANEAPWAMHYGASIINPVNTLGYMILGFQAHESRIVQLERENVGWQDHESRIVSHESRITQLEQENERLRSEVASLRRA